MFRSTRLLIQVILPAMCLSAVASQVHASDEGLSYESAQQDVAKLIDSVGPAYECDISVVSFRTAPPAFEDVGSFIVVLNVSGQRCDEAHKVLAYRGKSSGLLFFLEKSKQDRTKISEQEWKDRNLDLIHEIDPPNDT